MKKVLIHLLFTAIAICANAQIKGEVTNQDGAPVENATVVMQTPDSIYVQAACTDSSGTFHIATDVTNYRLIVQHVQYETHEKSYTDTGFLSIALKEKAYTTEELIVKGEQPLVKLVEGKIVYDMPRLLANKIVSNIYESLLQLPGVRAQNETLVLAGSTSVTLLINGQMTAMPAAHLIATLKMLPYNQVKSVEIMYSAPPQYHIRGAAINILLKEDNTEKGVQGQVNTGYTQKHYANYYMSTSLLYATAKLAVNMNYSYRYNHEKSGIDIFSKHLYKGELYTINQSNRGNKKGHEHHVRFALDYKLSEKDKLGLSYTAQLTTGMDKHEVSTGTLSQSVNHKENTAPIQMHHLLLNYTSGSGLKAGMEYIKYLDYTSQHFKEEKAANDFIANSRQRIAKYRLFADQSHTAGRWTLNYGGQYIYATDRSSQIYTSETGQDMSAANMNSSLKEYTGNLYVGFEKNIHEKLSLSASLTGEYYNYAGYTEWTLFPALEATYSISPSHRMILSFSSDKIYPAYWELHGGISYLNGYAELHGNPLLEPARAYSGQLSYLLKSKYILTAYYNYLDKYFVQLPYQDPDKLVLIYQSLNFDYMQTIGLNLIVPFGLGQMMDTRLTLNGFYNKVKSTRFHDTSFNNDNFTFYSRLDNSFTISSKPAINLELSGAYITKSIQGPATLSSLWNVEAGIKWSFWNGLAEIKLKGTDLLNRWTPDMVMKYNTQNLRMHMIPDSRAVSLSFTFRPGNFKPSEQKIDSSRFGTK